MHPTQMKNIPDLGVLGPCMPFRWSWMGNVLSSAQSQELFALLEMVLICSFQRRSSDR